MMNAKKPYMILELILGCEGHYWESGQNSNGVSGWMGYGIFCAVHILYSVSLKLFQSKT